MYHYNAIQDDNCNKSMDLKNLAGLLSAQRKCDKTEPRYRCSLAIVEKASGENDLTMVSWRKEVTISLSRPPGCVECQRKIFTDMPGFDLFLRQELDVTTQFSFTLKHPVFVRK